MAKGITLQELDKDLSNKLAMKNEVGSLLDLQTNDKSNLVAAMNELFTNVSNGKIAVASAITGKGVPATGSDTFAQLAAKITQINIGKKWATGNTTAPDGYTDYITGSLSFRPSLIFVYADIGVRVGVLAYYSHYSTTRYYRDGSWNAISPGYVSNTGFSLAIFLGGNKTDKVSWIAVE